MSVDSSTGLISWTPTLNNSANSDVVLQVYDALGDRTTQSFTIDVLGGNHKPVFGTPVITGGKVGEPGGQGGQGGLGSSNSSLTIQGKEGQPLQIQLTATDADNNLLNYWVNNLPPGAVFDSNTHMLTWNPLIHTAGTYNDVQFTVSDGIEQVYLSASIEIAPTNFPTLGGTSA